MMDRVMDWLNSPAYCLWGACNSWGWMLFDAAVYMGFLVYLLKSKEDADG